MIQRSVSSSPWNKIEPIGLDAIKQLTIAFGEDKDPTKVLLGEGVYKDDEGKQYVLPSVRKAEEVMFKKELDHGYAPVGGINEFCKLVREFGFGTELSAVKEDRIATVQTLSGTGSLRLAAEFLKRFLPENVEVYFPNPTWANHIPIFKSAGLTNIKAYRYFHKQTNGMDVEGCLEDIRNAPEGSVIVLHACAHNPTGVDPTAETWSEISKLCKEKNHVVFFDSAYQGFASGDPVQDAKSFRTFVEDGHTPIVCQSFAKNFGLYGERAGALNVVCATPQEAKAVNSQLCLLIRAMYSNPPLYGARIVQTVLGNEQLHKEWSGDVKEMANRIRAMREGLVATLGEVGSKKNWSHITDQIGMFAFSGLTPEQVDVLREKHHIYMTRDGRMSISGLNSGNLKTVATAIHEVTKE